ncbi:hypothetical protein N9D61_08215 [Planktomarina sp.]|jgi:hypothetical protein|nr:hypothetical protein [Planktomarina sp.]
MSFYKSTNHILAHPYEKPIGDFDPNFYYPTESIDWDYNQKIEINDVKMWQQLHYCAGGVGVYVSHIPKIEFYMITYNTFIDRSLGIKTFYGKEAVNEVISKCNELGIELPITTEFVSN